MKTSIIPFAVIIALTSLSVAQVRKTDPTPVEKAARIQAIRDARLERFKAEAGAIRQEAIEAGRVEARASRVSDRAFMAVWTGLTPEVKTAPFARELAERLRHRPEWTTRSKAQRIAAVSDFITNYPAIRQARHQAEMNSALGQGTAAFPPLPDMAALTRVLTASPDQLPSLAKAGAPVDIAVAVRPPDIAGYPQAEAPDLFTINRNFHWSQPHGQWMSQLLKDIDAARAAGDDATYRDLTTRYTTWADRHLRNNR